MDLIGRGLKALKWVPIMVNSKCIFLASTAHGTRCALLSIEDWKKTRERYSEFCRNNGKGCPLLARYSRRSNNNIFLSEVMVDGRRF